MRKILILLCIYFGFHYVSFAQADTVVITYDESKTEVPYEIQLNDKIIVFADDDLYYRESPRKKLFKIHWAGVELGFNGYINDNFQYSLDSKYDFLELKNTKSTNFNWNIFDLGFNIAKQKLGFGFGLGLQWNNYRFSNNVVLTPDSTGINGYKDDTKNAEKSKLMVLWMRVPLLLEFHNRQDFYIAAGPVFGVRLSSHSKQVYYEEDSKKKPKSYDDFYLAPIKVDGEVRMGYKNIGFFATYSFTEMYKNGDGPVLHPYTIGISLVF